MTHTAVRAHHAPITRRNAGPPAGEPAPVSYATPAAENTYVRAMTARAENRSETRTVPLVFVAGYRPRYGFATVPARMRAELESTLAPARLIGRIAVWPHVAKPGIFGDLPDYPDGLPIMAERVDGLVLLLHPSGFVSHARAAEIRAVRTAGRPVLVRAPGGMLVPLVDCRGSARGDGVRIELPAPARDRATLTAALAAIGTTGVGR